MILLIVASGLADWALLLVLALKAFGGYKLKLPLVGAIAEKLA